MRKKRLKAADIDIFELELEEELLHSLRQYSEKQIDIRKGLQKHIKKLSIKIKDLESQVEDMKLKNYTFEKAAAILERALRHIFDPMHACQACPPTIPGEKQGAHYEKVAGDALQKLMYDPELVELGKKDKKDKRDKRITPHFR